MAKQSFKGIKEELLQLIEYSDLVVLDGKVVKNRNKKKENLYFYEGAKILDNNRMYVNITRYTTTLEIISVKIKCRKDHYVTNSINTLVDSIINKGDYVVNLNVV